MNVLTLLILLAAAATVVSLASGIFAMGKGGDVAHHNSTEWMVSRLVFQGIALLLMVIALFIH